jgi:hypothetical protein
MGRLGDKLETGEDFRPYEVEDMARRLWARHLDEKNGADARPVALALRQGDRSVALRTSSGAHRYR